MRSPCISCLSCFGPTPCSGHDPGPGTSNIKPGQPKSGPGQVQGPGTEQQASAHHGAALDAVHQARQQAPSLPDPTATYNDIKARIEELYSGLCKSTLDTVEKAMRDAEMNKAAITDVPMGTKACGTGAPINDVPMGTNHVQVRPRLQAQSLSGLTATDNNFKARIEVICSSLYKSTLDTVEKAMRDTEINKAAITDVPMATNHVQARSRLQAPSLSGPSTNPGRPESSPGQAQAPGTVPQAPGRPRPDLTQDNAQARPWLQASRIYEQSFTFILKPSEAAAVQNSQYKVEARTVFRKQLQMRFSLLETSGEQEDNFPPSIHVKVNSKRCPLPNPVPTSKPGVVLVRPAKLINITPLCKLSSTSSNKVVVSWAVEVGRAHSVSVCLVEQPTHQDRLQQLKAKGQRQPDYTRALIKEKLADDDQEITSISCKTQDHVQNTSRSGMPQGPSHAPVGPAPAGHTPANE